MKEQIVTINTEKMERPPRGISYSDVKNMMYQQSENTLIIMVQAFERCEKTRMCVESILKYTKKIPFELVLLDNGSQDGETFEYFKSVEYEPKTIMRVTKNITGVFAVNTVIRMLKAKYLVIVNNDVIVTENWLDNMLKCAESDEKIGIVCPVSTNISNRQEEDLGGFSDLEEMQKKAADFNVSDWRKWEERLRIIPSATLFRMEIFDEAGLFDVGFVHDFGDDDFSFRVRRAGYKLIVCRDTFVHHNHYMQERQLDGWENERCQLGKIDFQRKHNGLDAWEDGANHIVEFPHFQELNLAKDTEIRILGVDTRCGTPILDVKNQLKLAGYSKFSMDAFTTEIKYYIDLQSMCEGVEHDNISNILSKYRDKKYGAIVLGEAINQYDKPLEVLMDLVALLDKQGVLICNLYNTDNIYEYLWQQGLLQQRQPQKHKNISYEEMIEKLRTVLLNKLDIKCTIHPIQNEICEYVNNTAYASMEKGREERIQNLYVKEYWFWIQKA